jgi:hypothetical protein
MQHQPIWEKEISDVFTLIEYPETSKEPRCLIIQTWGIDRESITNSQCSIVFQAVVEVGIVDEISGFTFKEALAWASD